MFLMSGKPAPPKGTLPVSTSPITLPSHRARPLNRRQERKMLAAALRRRDRARKLNDITYRYRHAMMILATTGFAVTAIVVGHTLLVLMGGR